MEIRLQAQVECTDGTFGQSEYVLINPVAEQVSHVVVRQAVAPHTEYIVPISAISATVADTLQLSCTKAELQKMDPFIQTDFIAETVPDIDLALGGGMTYGTGSYYYWPYASRTKTVWATEDHQQTPAGEVAVRRGTCVEATNGYVGKVDEFVINPETSRITHLVMRKGHLWGNVM